METINSRMFYKAWLDTVKGRKETMLKIWNSNKEFTRYIKGGTDSVMDGVAKKLELICYHADYYSIDSILYKKEDLVEGLGENNYWLRDMRVAFEHENNCNSGLFQEVSHLLITNCDLRVLVTYPNNHEKDHLDFLHKVIKGNRHSSTIASDESFLVIFGYQKGFEWDGYIYKDNDWQII
jgi:hypothetical protein